MTFLFDTLDLVTFAVCLFLIGAGVTLAVLVYIAGPDGF